MSETEEKITELETQIQHLKAQKFDELLKTYVKPLKDISDDHKIEWFDGIWQAAYEELITKIDEGVDYCDDNDNEHWAWEAQMDILGKNIFELYNRTDLA